MGIEAIAQRMQEKAQWGMKRVEVKDENGEKALVFTNFASTNLNASIVQLIVGEGYMPVSVYRKATGHYQNANADGMVHIAFAVDPTTLQEVDLSNFGADLSKWRQIAEKEWDASSELIIS